MTASARSKLGNPVNFALCDESGVYTKRSGMFEVADTVLRGVTGMDGRMLELTNRGTHGRELRAGNLRVAGDGHHEVLPPA